MLEPAGLVFLPMFGVAALLGWAAGGVGLLFSACGSAVLLVALFGALRNSRELELRVMRTAAHSVGQSFLFELEVTSCRKSGVARDLFFSCTDARDTSTRSTSSDRPIGGLASLAPGQRAIVECGYRHLRRGWRRALNVVLHSSHPFGLLRVERSYELQVDFLAWPRPGGLRRNNLLRSKSWQEAARLQRSKREEEDFHQLRPWREGMSLRRVHWKLSARRGRPILQEFSGEVDSIAHLGLLLFATERGGLARGERHSFESAVSLTATLAQHYLNKGLTVSLTLHGMSEGGADAREIHAGLRGRRGFVRALDALAQVEVELVSPEELARRLELALEASSTATLVFAGGTLGRHSPGPGPISPLGVIDVDSAEIDSLFQRSGEPALESRAAGLDP